MPRVWRLGDSVNTDQIIPGRYNVTTDRAQLAHYCLYEHRPDFASGAINDLARGHIFHAEPLPEFVQRIVEAGGIIPLVRQQGRLAAPPQHP